VAQASALASINSTAMAITCRQCGAINSHLTHRCPNGREDPVQYMPAISEADPNWVSRERDLSDPKYVAWLKGPHRVVIQELANLRTACEGLKDDIELDGPVKELMLAGWRHGPYAHDPEAARAPWKKYVLKAARGECGRVRFLRKSMAIEFEDTTGQMRTLNAKNFFTEKTPADNALKHVMNAVRDSPEWKGREKPCGLSVEALARRVLEVFPQVEYRREGDVKVFVCGKRRSIEVYTFIEEELRSSLERETSAHPEPSDAVPVCSMRMPPPIPVCDDRAISELQQARLVRVLAFSRMPKEVHEALVSSELAEEARAGGVDTAPEWARGAKIFVPLAAEDVPEDTVLRHWHVLVYDDDVPRVHQTLQMFRCKQRPTLKSAHALHSSADVEHEEVDVALDCVVENTFVCMPEPDYLTLRSKYTYSCNDAIQGHINPRSKEHVVQHHYFKLKACRKRRDLHGAVQCYSSLRACGAVDKYIFTILIDLCGKVGEYEQAETWAHKMFDDGFKPDAVTFNCLIGCCALLSVEVKHVQTGKLVKGKGDVVKQMKRPEVRPSHSLLNGSLCREEEEPTFGKKTHIGRGIPSMEVRLVFDTLAYPPPWARDPYLPRLFVDEFWMTPDRLVKLNKSGDNTFESEVHFNLMSAARWRFQLHMENAMANNAKLFGEDSEEQLQMRDLFANTNPYLLVVTLIVSVLHMIFEFLAFKNDVQFWQGCDPAMLNKYMSVQSIVVGIFMQIVLLMYLWDESANILVLITSIVGILIDVWKVQRAMKLRWVLLAGVIPVLILESKVKLEKKDDFDAIAMKWLTLILSPGIIGYAIYSLVVDCHRGWWSYFLAVSASCVYSLGFILMTPQVFINYKHKTVAYLPWRKFIYRAMTDTWRCC